MLTFTNIHLMTKYYFAELTYPSFYNITNRFNKIKNYNNIENIYFIIYLFIFKHLVYLNKFKFFTRSQKKLIKIIQIII